MSASFDFEGRVVLVTGACGALGSAVCEAFDAAGATVCATDLIDVESEDSLLDPGIVDFYEGDFTDEDDVERVVGRVVDAHDRLDALANVAGTWKGGQPIDETSLEQFDMLFDVNLKTAFLASKHALPHLRETEGSIVSVSARSSLSGGEGDGPYRASKAGIRLLTETLAEENRGAVRASCVMPSVIDTPANREMMDGNDDWVDPADIADVFLFLCSDAASPTSGAAVPVYGEA
ncbi:SDR family oxidoreductase [Halalkalicoccus ordinarius]|uniref:SDR family oxidoreductase n=1 Tax=Halalkalicoccus ordinarius TaxID=3116651 RepID=UPI00300EB2F1